VVFLELLELLRSKNFSFEERGKNIKIDLEKSRIDLKELKQKILGAGFSIKKPSGKDNFILLFFGQAHVATIVEEKTLLLHNVEEKKEATVQLVSAL
jgi:hypothetical protein